MSLKCRHFYGLLTSLVLSLLLGCSKSAETTTSELTERPSPPAATSTVAGSPASPVMPAAPSQPSEPSPVLRTPQTKSSTADSSVGSTRGSPALPTSPAEIAQMLKSTGNWEAAHAAIREYAAKNPGAHAELATLAKRPDADTALLGAHGLAGLGTPEAAVELVAAIQGAAHGVGKRELSAALGTFNSPGTAQLFLGLLGTSEDREVLAGAEKALSNVADAPVVQDILQRYEASNSSTERENLLAALRHMQTASCVPALLDIVNQQKVISTTDPIGLAAVDTLGIIGNAVAVSNLFAHLTNVREGGSSPIYDAIGRVSNPESLPLIASVAYGQVPGISLYSRMAAVQALGNYNAQQAQPALNWLIENDPSAGIREAAAGALKRVTGQ